MKEIIMDLIIHSGEARSYAMEAIQLAKAGDVDGARSLIEKASIQLGKAHKSQTALIQDEASDNKIEISMLLIHAQNQLMTTMTLKDLANEIIDLYEKLNQKNF
ncbi:TPA: PTS lactose/cellobiose transporter subunit IIA [Clostridium perfringens]|nr:PTS lactose/cellobiose transporter subunit IIA [Clostridium perfringens]HAT4096957.1 PTS lactose/cellobiose transporter subunit IIA [Clostridium perfringens]